MTPTVRNEPVDVVRGSPDKRDRDSGVKLPELVGAFSLATDLGMGLPMEHVLRSWRIAGRLGEHLGVEADESGALYYVTTLAWVGCVADTPEVAAVFGDDIGFRRDSYDVDFAGLPTPVSSVTWLHGRGIHAHPSRNPLMR